MQVTNANKNLAHRPALVLVSPYFVSLFAYQSVSLCHANPTVVEPVLRALSARSAGRPPVTAAPVVKDKPKDKSAGTH